MILEGVHKEVHLCRCDKQFKFLFHACKVHFFVVVCQNDYNVFLEICRAVNNAMSLILTMLGIFQVKNLPNLQKEANNGRQ